MVHLTSDLDKTEAPISDRSAHSSEAWARAYQIVSMTGCSATEARQLYARIDPTSKKTIKWEDGRSVRAAINRVIAGTSPKHPVHADFLLTKDTPQAKLRAIADYIDACGNVKTAIAHIDAIADYIDACGNVKTAIAHIDALAALTTTLETA